MLDMNLGVLGVDLRVFDTCMNLGVLGVDHGVLDMRHEPWGVLKHANNVYLVKPYKTEGYGDRR